uniref:Nedd4 family interacting protein 1, like n=1 Tax=Oreochromis niloticus TaxID=8128 RepID=A0A669CQ49_ORENI
MAESSPRYQQLSNEEDSEESPQVAADAPPPYSSVTADNSAFFDYKEDGVFPKPPSYNVATTLPSYDEAERTKAETNVPLVPGRQPQHRDRLETFDDVIRSSLEDEDFVTRDDFEDADQLRIGNDGIFMLTFFMAFLFNWIGFFLSFCLTTSAAGRYGAISGFGLSLVKWILIVRASCSFSEDSSTMPESARWRTLSPPCPAPGSSSSTKPLHSFFSCFYSETHCFALFNQIGRKYICFSSLGLT